MKIVFLNYYQNSAARGLETFVAELSGRLSKNHTILILPAPSGAVPTATELSLPRRFFLDPASLKVAFWTIRSLPALIRFRPQIVFSTNGGWQALILSIFCRLAGAKMVIAGQSGPGWDDRVNLLMKPHLFIALTKRQLDWAKKTAIWKQDFALIPNGVDLDQFKPAGKKAKLNLAKPVIMMVAASTEAKRVGQGIAAVAKLAQGSFLLLGRGPLDERINKLGYKLLGPNRFLHLSVKHHQMPDYYRSADLFTLCSASSEAFGIVYLEALASGLPCVATDDASRREIVGSAGIFVKDPDNVDEYAAAIQTALAKKWRNTPLIQAQKYSWDNTLKGYQKELDRL